MASKYRNTGQTCVCVNRIYVQDSVYDAFAPQVGQAELSAFFLEDLLAPSTPRVTSNA